MPAPEQQIARLEFVVREQMKEIDKLREEVERLRTGADAHTTLQAIYRNPASPEGNRIKAAAASLPVEKPKLLSVVAPMEVDRREAWRVYQRWALKRQIIKETHELPAPGWDAHLVGDTYQPPERDDMPPVRVVSDPTSGFRTLDSLLPGAGRRNGNGDGIGGSEPSEDEPEASGK